MQGALRPAEVSSDSSSSSRARLLRRGPSSAATPSRRSPATGGAWEAEKARAGRVSHHCHTCRDTYGLIVLTLVLLSNIVFLYAIFVRTDTLTARADSLLTRAERTGIIEAIHRVANATNVQLDVFEEEHLDKTLREFIRDIRRVLERFD
jgi:hypothetical protein